MWIVRLALRRPYTFVVAALLLLLLTPFVLLRTPTDIFPAINVPILQFGISNPKLSEQQIFDLSINQIRVGLISVTGAAIPWPYGGRQRLVSVDLDLTALKAQNLAPQDVVNAINAQNLVFPSGT